MYAHSTLTAEDCVSSATSSLPLNGGPKRHLNQCSACQVPSAKRVSKAVKDKDGGRGIIAGGL